MGGGVDQSPAPRVAALPVDIDEHSGLGARLLDALGLNLHLVLNGWKEKVGTAVHIVSLKMHLVLNGWKEKVGIAVHTVNLNLHLVLNGWKEKVGIAVHTVNLNLHLVLNGWKEKVGTAVTTLRLNKLKFKLNFNAHDMQFSVTRFSHLNSDTVSVYRQNIQQCVCV